MELEQLQRSGWVCDSRQLWRPTKAVSRVQPLFSAEIRCRQTTLRHADSEISGPCLLKRPDGKEISNPLAQQGSGALRWISSFVYLFKVRFN